MTSYADILTTFSKAIRGDSTAEQSITAHISHNGIPASLRLFVHQNHFYVTAKETLRANFPTVTKLVDEGFFDFIAHQYVAQTPPSDPRIATYGETFPNFIAQHPAIETTPFLADIADFDLRMRQVCQHAPHPALDLNKVAEVPVEDQANIILAPTPCCHIVISLYPIADIWSFASHQTEAPDMSCGQSLIITQEQGQPVFERLARGTAVFGKTLFDGQTLGQAAEAALKADPSFDLGTEFGTLLVRGVFTDLVWPSSSQPIS